MARVPETLLAIERLTAGYGDVPVVHGATLHIEEGECVALVGTSGAGKTTLSKAIAGLVPVLRGSVRYAGQDLAALPAHKRVGAGIAVVPEGRRLFAGMSVRQNLQLGSFTERGRERIAQRLATVHRLFPVLEQRAEQIAGTMSGGEQQMCAIGRALMSGPRLLVIDEVSLGLAPKLVEAIIAALAAAITSGMSLLLIDQDIGTVLPIATRSYILQNGRIVREGAPREIVGDAGFRRDYLGY
jgi:branched-chain amino acid transport system ATP-binding protein